MRRNINNVNINKKFILSKIDQIKIFSVYLGISESAIEYCINTGELICSPLRNDNHPTCGFKYDNKGKLKFKDFAGYIWGDCFDIAAYVISAAYNKNINIANKRDFIGVLKHIAFTFSDIIYGKTINSNINEKLEDGRKIIQKSKSIIEFVTRDWNYNDIKYWKEIGVSIQWLNTHFVYPVEQYYINRKINPKPKYYYTSNDPCYAYINGADEKGIHDIKLYFPKRDKHNTRFITNYSHMEGIYNLERNDYDWIIITKSSKDRICLDMQLYLMISLYGGSFNEKIGVINIPAENYKLSLDEYYWLYGKLSIKDPERIISFMDNDETGYIETKYLVDTYKTSFVIIPKKYKVKDFAELRKQYGYKTCSKLIIKTLNILKRYVRKNKYVRDAREIYTPPF